MASYKSVLKEIVFWLKENNNWTYFMLQLLKSWAISSNSYSHYSADIWMHVIVRKHWLMEFSALLNYETNLTTRKFSHVYGGNAIAIASRASFFLLAGCPHSIISYTFAQIGFRGFMLQQELKQKKINSEFFSQTSPAWNSITSILDNSCLTQVAKPIQIR